MEFIFFMQINIKVSTSWCYHFFSTSWCYRVIVTRHIQSTQNRKLVSIKEKVLQLLLCSIVMQNIQLFDRDPVMFVVTCFLYIDTMPCRSGDEIKPTLLIDALLAFFIAELVLSLFLSSRSSSKCSWRNILCSCTHSVLMLYLVTDSVLMLYLVTDKVISVFFNILVSALVFNALTVKKDFLSTNVSAWPLNNIRADTSIKIWYHFAILNGQIHGNCSDSRQIRS